MTEAQRGTITHNTQGASLTGIRTGTYDEDFYFQIEGSVCSNNFQRSDWTFTPDKPALPTEPGFYRPKSDLNWNGAYHLNNRGEWSYINGLDGDSTPQDTGGINTPLVRLIPETKNA